MALSKGANLGSYTILSPLGKGGMGEVWQARDGRLERDVAIKVLPEAMASDRERLLRFEREAKLLASLNHGNIAHIYGFEDAGETRFLVLEYVAGETLAQRLRRGPLPMDEALDVCRQIAEALEAAHDQGVIHRDLKPGNVMLRPDGTVKVLDFGLARALPPNDSTVAVSADSPTGAADSPTITAEYTTPGVVLGTAAYMSPEQARGRPLDRRTDIWSFGIILFECLSGQQLFKGETANDSIGAIMHKDPDWRRLPASTPPTIRLMLRRCLARERHRRLQAIGDARLELQDGRDSDGLFEEAAPRRRPGSAVIAVLPWVVCAVLGIGLVVMLTRGVGRSAAPTSNAARRTVLTLPPDTGLNWRGSQDTWSKIGFSQLLAISPDGRRIIMTLQQGQYTNLYLKDDADFFPRKVAGAALGRGAFFSPDGEWVGFQSEHVLHKVRLPGGAAQPICEISTSPFDATWLEDDTIIFSAEHGLRRVSSDGGDIENLTTLDIDGGVWGHNFPHAIRGKRTVVFTVTGDSGQHAALLSLDDNSWTIIKRHATGARYVAGGHLVFARNGELFASPYDPDDPLTVGTEVPIVRGVQTIGGQGGAVVHLFATSDTGRLIYAPQIADPQPDTLMWVDHEGNEQAITSGSGLWMHQRLSPTGDKVLFNRLTPNGMLDLYIYDFNRDQINPLTRTGHTYDAEWGPKGQTICFNALDTMGRSTNLVPADFSASPRKLFDGRRDTRPHLCQWSHAGSTLVFFDRGPLGGIWTVPAEGQSEFSELINSDLGESWPQISPDGKTVAYVGWESGSRDIYIRTYPDLGPWIRVSQKGGGEPRWASDSRTLYFRATGKMFKASIVTEPQLDVQSVTALPFDDVYDYSAAGHQHYDISTDGTRFLMVKHGKHSPQRRVHIIENWMGAVR